MNGPKNVSYLIMKLDDIWWYSVVHDVGTSASDINKNLELTKDWAFQWKMNFNPDPSTQTQQIIISRKK